LDSEQVSHIVGQPGGQYAEGTGIAFLRGIGPTKTAARKLAEVDCGRQQGTKILKHVEHI
jgi:hypothetical protein